MRKVEVYEILLYAMPAVIVIGLVIRYGRKILRWTDNNHSEVIKYELKITEKKEEYKVMGASSAKGTSIENSPRRYYFTGETKDGQVIKGQVSFDVYDRLREGRRAFITMQRTRFIAFERIDEDEGNG